MSIPNLPVHIVVMGNGVFETMFGIMLLLGAFTRISSLLLSIHLFFIAISLGYNDLAIRDMGLTVATVAVFLNGPDRLCLDNREPMRRLLSRLPF